MVPPDRRGQLFDREIRPRRGDGAPCPCNSFEKKGPGFLMRPLYCAAGQRVCAGFGARITVLSCTIVSRTRRKRRGRSGIRLKCLRDFAFAARHARTHRRPNGGQNARPPA